MSLPGFKKGLMMEQENTEVWDQIAVTNGPHRWGGPNLRVHRRGGCKGRNNSSAGFGWHPETGTIAELAARTIRCTRCESAHSNNH